MKTLLLLRHAKSSWDDPALPDHERPLKKRGIKAARRMGQFVRQQALNPDLILCSTAVRARETLRLVLDEADIAPPIQYLEELFHCSPSQFVETLQRVSEPTATVLLVGHNPGLEEFLSQLCDQPETLPTATLARVELDVSLWSQLTEDSRGRLLEVWRPRELEDD